MTRIQITALYSLFTSVQRRLVRSPSFALVAGVEIVDLVRQIEKDPSGVEETI